MTDRPIDGGVPFASTTPSCLMRYRGKQSRRRRYSPLLLMIKCFVLVVRVSSGKVTCPAKPEEKLPFLNIGHAAGDPLSHCENTLEAAQSGLENGMNVVEVDVCMSRDGVLFLWHDCNMNDSLSIFRRLGKFVPNNMCLPYHHPSTYGKQPHQLSFATIKRHYGYKRDYDQNKRLPYQIPTLRDFIHRIGTSPQIKRIYIDVKVLGRKTLNRFYRALFSVAREFDVENKLLLGGLLSGGRSLFTYVRSLQVVRESKARMVLDIGFTMDEIGGSNYTESLTRANDILEVALRESSSVSHFDKVWIGSFLIESVASFTDHAIRNFERLYKKHVENQKIIKHAEEHCLSYVSLGISPLAQILSHDRYKRALRKAVNKRHEVGYPAKIIAWTINDNDLLHWIASSGVDGVITDKPGVVHSILQSRKFNQK